MNTINLLSDAKFFDDSNTKLHELRAMLDSKSISQKLDAMKKLIAMMTLGRDVSAFFPDVVKNVIVDSLEVKKLVYMFLIDYSEHNQDLALLSINTFQKDLLSQNQRVRASALKAMSSIRIPVAGPLVMLALKQSIKDSSSYVKRAAAAAIPKVLSYGDHSHDYTEELIEMIEVLLQSNEPTVLGSALFAYQSVCPHRFDLLHKHFRKICHLLADFDEWGQIMAVNILTRYGRTQFLAPEEINQTNNQSNKQSKPTSAHVKSIKLKSKKTQKKSSAFYSDDDSSISQSSSESDSDRSNRSSDDSDMEPINQSNLNPASHMDEDHLLLIRQSQSLLYSSNSGVILAVVALHWYLAPHSMTQPIIRPLVRLARNKRSLQYLLLRNILTMVKAEPKMFEPFTRDFYVNHTDALYVKALKLEILSHCVSETCSSAVLGELGCYVRDHDPTFVCLAIRCLGACAIRLPMCSEKSLQMLLRLTQSTHLKPAVIGESVVMIRTLLQSNEGDNGPVVKRMVKLLDTIVIPSARASIVWMVGEYRDQLSMIAPDVLRKLAQSFKDEHTVVKMQTLELAVKLFLSNPKQTSLLFKYIMDLSKYDLDYDLRDRARLLRALFFKKKGTENENDAQVKLVIGTDVKEAMKGLFLMPKPAPSLRDPTLSHDKFTLGTMSQALGVQVAGYVDLPSFPHVQPDPSVRRPPAEEPAYTRKDKRRVSASKSEQSISRSNSESQSEEESDFSHFDGESDRSDVSRSSRSDSESERSSESEDERNRRSVKSRDRRRRRRSDSESSRSPSRSRSRSRSRSGSDRSDSASNSDLSRSESSDSEDDRRSRREKEKTRERERVEREKQKQRERKAEQVKVVENDKRSKSSDKDKKSERESRSLSKSPIHQPIAVTPSINQSTNPSSTNPLTDLLDLSDMGSALDAAVTSSLGSSLSDPLDLSLVPRSQSPSQNTSSSSSSHSEPIPLPGVKIPSRGARGSLLNPISSGGLRMDYMFSRKPSLYGSRMVDIELTCVNESTGPFECIRMRESDETLQSYSDGFDDMSHSELDIGEQHGTKVHVDFMGKVQSRCFIVEMNETTRLTVKLTPPAGELIRSHLCTLKEWKNGARQLSGMSEHRLDVTTRMTNLTQVAQKICDCANVVALGEYEEDEKENERQSIIRFSGQRLDNEGRVLIQVKINQEQGKIALLIHAEDFVFATALQSEIKKALA